MTDPTGTYLQDLRDIRSTGANVKETSFYPALSNLLNEVGKTLRPKVRCVINLANRGAGLPDGGLFTPDQFQRASEANPLPGQPPPRGAIEIKGTGGDVRKIATSDQVIRYLQKYRQVFVTNYRDFVLTGRGADGHPAKIAVRPTLVARDEMQPAPSFARRDGFGLRRAADFIPQGTEASEDFD